MATAAVAGPAFAAGLGVVDWVAARADLGARGTATGGVALLAASGLAVAAIATGAGGVLPALVAVVGPVVGVPAVLDSRVRSRGALLRAGIGGLLALGAIGGGALWATGSGALVGWSGPAVALGAIGAAATLLPREDVGSTLTTGAFAAFVGLVLLAGAIDPGWAWDVTNIPETASTNAGAGGGVTGQIAVPGLVAVAALLVAWAGAKSYGGYGAEGRERGAFVLLYLNAAAILAAMGLVVGFVVYRGAGPALRGAELHWDSVSIRELGLSIPHPNVRWPFVELGYSFVPEIPNGILPPLVGTFWIVLGAVLLGVPLALGAAVYLSEFAEQAWFTRLVETATNALWSTPSVVYGLFAFSFIVLELGISQSIFAGQLVLAFMLIPLVLITSREAIVAVPDEYRDASAALGVTQWQTIRSVVLPAAMPGILTGVILGVGRIAGETAPILLVVSSRLSAREAPNVLGSFRLVGHPPFVTNDALLSSSGALPLRIWTIISHGVAGPMEQGWGAAFVLLLLVLGFYAVGIAMRTYFRRKLTHD
ncbi:MAG: phosphate ABC transporter permease PstA [Halobacteriaceae archaeon]